MTIWLEALTAKQALLMGLLARELIRRGYEAIVTTRSYDYTVGVLENLGVEPVVIGRYGGKKLEEKLFESLRRQMKLAKLISRVKVEAHVSFTSPDSSRVAFGLKIPIILLSDSPHSKAVNRLTLPLADKLITPVCIPRESFSYAIDAGRIVTFNGYFELAWIYRLKPDKNVVEKLGLTPYRYVIARPEEAYAAYYPVERPRPTVLDVILEAVPEEYDIVVFPRYPSQTEYLKERLRGRIIIPERSLDTRSLISYSALVITGGATFAQEAALMGVPSITYFPEPIYVTDDMASKGFPIHHVADIWEARELASSILSNPFRKDVSHILENMEDPISIVLENIESAA